MVDIEFDDDPTPGDIEGGNGRIQTTGATPMGIADGCALDYDADSKTLSINFEQLSRTLVEHRMFKEAEGFSSTEMELLRIIEEGLDRMSISEIKAQVQDFENDEDTLADSTIQYYLR